MTLDQLETLEAIVVNGSFRAAAEKLNRSQPALSSSIKNLEEELGLILFDRKQYRPVLTEQGAAFLKVARDALSSAQYASRVGFELGQKKVESQLKILVDPLVSIRHLKRIAHECLKPDVPITLVVDKTILKGSYDRLISGEVDLALAPCPEDESKVEKIMIEKITLVGAVAKKLAKTKLARSRLNKIPHVYVYENLNNDDLKNFGEDSSRLFVPDHSTKLELIRCGAAWGRITKDEAIRHPEVQMLEKSLVSHVELEMCLLRPRHRPIGPTARSIWSSFLESTK